MSTEIERINQCVIQHTLQDRVKLKNVLKNSIVLTISLYQKME